MKPITMTEVDYEDAVDSNLGLCTNCREWTHDSAEPDAVEYKCPKCEGLTVFGAEEALVMGLIEFSDANDSD